MTAHRQPEPPGPLLPGQTSPAPPGASTVAATTEGDVAPVDWWSYAACRGMPAAIFFPPSGWPRRRHDAYDEARRVCAGCRVEGPCLDDALAHPQTLGGGMRAGLRPAELDRERQRRRLAR